MDSGSRAGAAPRNTLGAEEPNELSRRSEVRDGMRSIGEWIELDDGLVSARRIFRPGTRAAWCCSARALANVHFEDGYRRGKRRRRSIRRHGGILTTNTQLGSLRSGEMVRTDRRVRVYSRPPPGGRYRRDVDTRGVARAKDFAKLIEWAGRTVSNGKVPPPAPKRHSGTTR